MSVTAILFAVVSLIVAVLTAAARTGPVEAKSNLSSWAAKLGLPQRLRSKKFTRSVAVAGPIVFTICFIAFLFTAFLPKFIAGMTRLEIVGWHFFPPGEPRTANWAPNDIFGVIAIARRGLSLCVRDHKML
jgi:hypothetical protein